MSRGVRRRLNIGRYLRLLIGIFAKLGIWPLDWRAVAEGLKLTGTTEAAQGQQTQSQIQTRAGKL
ncbi:hypothetical protein N7499_000575 [Penicillium canescens]|uniref:Uncharacterized protein n=1 Tax=Penicillium canescens TaxID=5083 RepID=A0AAD6IIW5_PENCN|nr:uncharacterized protein N7446_011224 [Penicillium canescens]KAJ6004507.1 hypothetical protein N7522_006152 [Penicillium canescens]KAJ6029427.1 hypothetical protein N7444_012414 [Penicillium canescens]KAJ6047857.1 hypothetical protein N7460_004004 [Penicillium canescens]KAJ6048541.1 hypothetical protein N7446_011224 [Penicillium canescens]KAJ6100945.1 hypothetical protein N7499_000575 [Penicillium canescens]